MLCELKCRYSDSKIFQWFLYTYKRDIPLAISLLSPSACFILKAKSVDQGLSVKHLAQESSECELWIPNLLIGLSVEVGYVAYRRTCCRPTIIKPWKNLETITWSLESLVGVIQMCCFGKNCCGYLGRREAAEHCSIHQHRKTGRLKYLFYRLNTIPAL